MTIGEQFVAFFKNSTNTTVAENRVHQDHVPQGLSVYPQIWFSRSGEEGHTSFSGSQRIATDFDVECLSTNIDVAIDLSEVVRSKLDGYRGIFGATDTTLTVQGIFVDDKSDDYEFRNDASDEGIEVSALSVRIFHTD